MTGLYVSPVRDVENKYDNYDTSDRPEQNGLSLHRSFYEYIIERKMQMKHILRGQVYLAILTGTGCEQRGKRPVLIIQNNIGNHFSPTTLVAPITSSKKKRNLPVHVPVESNRLYKDSVILCEQIQVMDKSRLRKKLCTLGDDVMEQVDRAVGVSFDLNGGNTNE